MTVTHHRHISDIKPPVRFQLVRENESGKILPVSTAAATSVEFYMVNASTGATEIAQTSSGLTMTNAAQGKGEYDFSAGGVDTAGTYNAYVVVVTSGEDDTFPARAGDFQIVIHGDR